MSPTPATRTFTPLTSPDQFDALLSASSGQPVIIFKHSPTCGTSAMAYDELTDLLEGSGPEVHLLNVLSSRALSQAVAARLAIRHESPQVLVLKDGLVRWYGSHYRVTADAVRKAIAG